MSAQTARSYDKQKRSARVRGVFCVIYLSSIDASGRSAVFSELSRQAGRFSLGFKPQTVLARRAPSFEGRRSTALRRGILPFRVFFIRNIHKDILKTVEDIVRLTRHKCGIAVHFPAVAVKPAQRLVITIRRHNGLIILIMIADGNKRLHFSFARRRIRSKLGFFRPRAVGTRLFSSEYKLNSANAGA